MSIKANFQKRLKFPTACTCCHACLAAVILDAAPLSSNPTGTIPASHASQHAEVAFVDTACLHCEHMSIKVLWLRMAVLFLDDGDLAQPKGFSELKLLMMTSPWSIPLMKDIVWQPRPDLLINHVWHLTVCLQVAPLLFLVFFPLGRSAELCNLCRAHHTLVAGQSFPLHDLFIRFLRSAAHALYPCPM